MQILVQGSSSAISGQLTEDVRKHNLRNPGKEVLFLNVGGEALELTGQKCHFYHFRFATNADLRVKALTSVMSADGTLGKRVYAINQNYSWGQDMEGATERFAKQYGYEVVGKTLHEVNKIQDFAPYGAHPLGQSRHRHHRQLVQRPAAADESHPGRRPEGARHRVPGPGGQPGNAGEVALGAIAHPYNIEAAGEGAKFAEDYKAKTGHYPSYTEPQTVIGVTFLGEALKQVKPQDGKLSVPEARRSPTPRRWAPTRCAPRTTRCSCRWWFPRSARTPSTRPTTPTWASSRSRC